MLLRRDDPDYTLPVLLDVGTHNQERLDDPLYIGWRHARVTGADYDDFVEAFVTAVVQRWPDVLLQWEDFAGGNAGRLLARYRDRLCTFNDDIQSTAAIAVATLHGGDQCHRGCRSPATDRPRRSRFGRYRHRSLLLRAMVEAGADEQEARRRFYAVDRPGLLVEGMNGHHAGPGAVRAEPGGGRRLDHAEAGADRPPRCGVSTPSRRC